MAVWVRKQRTRNNGASIEQMEDASFAPGRPPGGFALWKYQCSPLSGLPGQFLRTHHKLDKLTNTERTQADDAWIRRLLPRSLLVPTETTMPTRPSDRSPTTFRARGCTRRGLEITR